MSEARYTVELPVFEGPLDLLLHLVKKHELNVLDIPISFITEKYLEYLDLMRGLNLDVAGEYLYMAATLAHLKSRELLPAPEVEPGEEGEEEGDPRQELIRRLLEYQKYKDAAESLSGRPVVGRNVWTRGQAIDASARGPAPLAEVPVYKLVEALSGVLARAKFKLTHDVIVDRVSIADRIGQLADRLAVARSMSFTACFEALLGGELGEGQARYEVVVTFLAILEMTRLRMVRLRQGAQPEVSPAEGSAPSATPPSTDEGATDPTGPTGEPEIYIVLNDGGGGDEAAPPTDSSTPSEAS
jgi:segregation and condensation protein A